MEKPFQSIKPGGQFIFEDGRKVFFTSDTHFNHANIIRFCNRPFADVGEMNERLIENWNSVVGPDDIVFHLGDFAWGGSDVWTTMLNCLNGHKTLIIGNHDMKNLRSGYTSYFDCITFQKQICVEGQVIYLNHYPFLCYGGVYNTEPVWQLFGHVHSTKDPAHVHEGKDDGRLVHLFPTQYDVGVDNNDYRPIGFHEVKEIIQRQIEKDKIKEPEK